MFTKEMEGFFDQVTAYYQGIINETQLSNAITELDTDDLYSLGSFKENILSRIISISFYYRNETKFKKVIKILLSYCQKMSNDILEKLLLGDKDNKQVLLLEILSTFRSFNKDLNHIIPVYLECLQNFCSQFLEPKSYLSALDFLNKETLFKIFELSDEINQLYLQTISHAISKAKADPSYTHKFKNINFKTIFERLDHQQNKIHDNMIIISTADSLRHFYEFYELFVGYGYLTKADQLCILTKSNKIGITPLHEAVMTNDLEKIKLCCSQIEKLSKGALKAALLAPNRLNYTVIHQMINNGNYKKSDQCVVDPDVANYAIDKFLLGGHYFTHEELFDFIENHPRALKCDEGKINSGQIRERIKGLKILLEHACSRFFSKHNSNAKAPSYDEANMVQSFCQDTNAAIAYENMNAPIPMLQPLYPGPYPYQNNSHLIPPPPMMFFAGNDKRYMVKTTSIYTIEPASVCTIEPSVSPGHDCFDSKLFPGWGCSNQG